MTPTAAYLAAAVTLFASHAVPSWPGVRPALVARLGRWGYFAAYSVVSVAALTLFIVTYRREPTTILFQPPGWAAPLAVAAMPVALLLVICRMTTRLIDESGRPQPPTGIARVTRFPGSVGIGLWAGLHLLATGDGARVALFATMAAIALFAIAKNDHALARRGDAGRNYREATSILPFVAIFTGRQRLAAGEIGLWRVGLALALWAGILGLHPLVFGVDPLAWWN